MSGSTIAILFLGLLGAYLLGSLPTGFVLAKVLKGIDIRDHGSGNTGATNVFRVLGKGPGITALVIDLLKGVLAVWLMSWLLNVLFLNGAFVGDSALSGSVLSGAVVGPDGKTILAYGGQSQAFDIFAWGSMLAALSAVLGHSKSIWLGFTGGKSAATGLGVLLALAWPVGLGVASVFGATLAVTRTVSIGSIAAALSAGVFMWLTDQPLPYILLSIAGGLYVVLRHRANISRLVDGTEPKTFGSKTVE